MNKIFTLSLPSAIACASLSAQTLLINFGATSYSGTNSPGHDSGNITGTTWNVAATDTASGILDQNGVSTSVSLDFGTTETDTGLTVNYANATKAADYASINGASAEQLGLFDTALGKSNAVRDGSGLAGLAVSLSGLAVGEYTFFITAFRGESPANVDRDYNIYAGASSDSITDFTTLYAGAITNPSEVGTWTAEANYITGTFVINETTDTFSILSQQDDFIGVLDSLELYHVNIPEPSTYAVFLGIGALGMVSCFRRKRRRA